MPIPTANILEKRGRFWWRGDETPTSHSIPDAAVPGNLVIQENGLATLRLDGSLLQAQFPKGLPFDVTQVKLDGRCIAGMTNEDRKWVYLLELELRDFDETVGRKITGEQYQAKSCLMGFSPARRRNEPFLFTRQSINMAGLEEWRRSDSIEVNVVDVDGRQVKQEVRYKLEEKEYELERGKLLVRADVYRDPSLQMATTGREVTFKQEDWVDFSPAAPASPAEMKAEFGLLEEFLAILTGPYYSLDWPSVSSEDGETVSVSYTLYFLRNVQKTRPPEMWNLWTVFPQVRDSFGTLYSAWKQKRQEYGSAFYLYLGTLRSSTLYVEDQFVNLIWGIESLHRKRHPGTTGASSEKATIEAILKKVCGDSNAEMRRWLKKQRERASEPTLRDRIVEIFKSLPWDIELVSLGQFAERCANRRNDISHYGGPREGENYNGFLNDLIELTNALSPLYHAALLYEIGLDGAILKSSFFELPIGYRIRRDLKQAGLSGIASSWDQADRGPTERNTAAKTPLIEKPKET